MTNTLWWIAWAAIILLTALYLTALVFALIAFVRYIRPDRRGKHT